MVTCQACLDPMVVTVTLSIDSEIVASVDDLLELDQQENGVVCAAPRISLVDLLEDDLIVALPMVPRHEDGGCGAEVPKAVHEEEAPVDTHRPFAGLAEMTEQFKRS